MNAADVIAQRLYQAGCRYAFGIPGGEVLTIVDALTRAGIEFILTKHENAAGFMAEGTWHATGAPGVLVATVGPGIANAVNVIANAEQDRVPLIAISGCVGAAEALSYTHQIFDHQAVLRPVVKATLEVAEGAADVAVEKALAIAMEGRKGPVHLDLPIAVAASDHPAPGPQRRPSEMTAPSGPMLAEAQEMFFRAERPLLWPAWTCWRRRRGRRPSSPSPSAIRSRF
jgi:acetolactate synthase-1/2/3 large subunit